MNTMNSDEEKTQKKKFVEVIPMKFTGGFSKTEE